MNKIQAWSPSVARAQNKETRRKNCKYKLLFDRLSAGGCTCEPDQANAINCNTFLLHCAH